MSDECQRISIFLWPLAWVEQFVAFSVFRI